MEAKWLFGVDLDQIQVVVQPQSVIHSMVEFVDGSVMAQLGSPDMRLPIQYALYRGERRFLDDERLDFSKLGSITFEAPDTETFKGLLWLWRLPEQGDLCLRYLMRPMKKLLLCFWTGRSLSWIFTGLLKKLWKDIR